MNNSTLKDFLQIRPKNITVIMTNCKAICRLQALCRKPPELRDYKDNGIAKSHPTWRSCEDKNSQVLLRLKLRCA